MTQPEQKPMPELKPCPFCGKTPTLEYEGGLNAAGDEDGHYYTDHAPCRRGLNVQSYGYDPDEAITAWNARADLAAVECADAPKRYWLIEQTDLDEDDDNRVIHTTDLDVYPDAKILGEYVLKQPTAQADRAAALRQLPIFDSINELLRLEDAAKGQHLSGPECKALFAAWRRLDFPETMKFFRLALTAPDNAEQLREVKTALEFYASPAAYQAGHGVMMKVCDRYVPHILDTGQVAQKALATLQSMIGKGE